MAKYNVKPGLERTRTHEGGTAVKLPSKMELLITLASTYAGEDTFYETANRRDERLKELIAEVTQREPTTAFDVISDLRSVYRIRTASIMAAAEYGRAGGPNARALVAHVIQRPDEAAEMVAYWLANYGGHTPPWWLRRGVADAVQRVYNERNLLKYDSRNALVRPADVIELTHPKPKAPWQSALFKYMLDERHHGDAWERYALVDVDKPALPTLAANHALSVMPEPNRRAFLTGPGGAQALADAGYTWERLSGWLPGGMDADAWEAVIPSMGVMALIRNLRNFDEAGISEAAVDQVIAKITTLEEVQRSRIFPYRVWTAYQNAPSDNWGRALGKTLDLTVGNVPSFDRSLILVDFSGSMSGTVSGRSKVARWEIASLMALVAARGSKNVDVAVFGENYVPIEIKPGSSILKQMQGMRDLFDANGSMGWSYRAHPGTAKYPVLPGHSTYGFHAMQGLFDASRHDKVLVFSDGQMHDDEKLARHVPTIVLFNLAGYSPEPIWGPGRYIVGGFSEAVYQIVGDYLG